MTVTPASHILILLTTPSTTIPYAIAIPWARRDVSRVGDPRPARDAILPRMPRGRPI